MIGDGAQFAGANVGPFWIIRDLPTGPQIVLQSGMLGLTIEASRSNKCLNVEAFTATAVEGTTTEFRFNGQKYVVYKQKTAKLELVNTLRLRRRGFEISMNVTLSSVLRLCSVPRGISSMSPFIIRIDLLPSDCGACHSPLPPWAPFGVPPTSYRVDPSMICTM